MIHGMVNLTTKDLQTILLWYELYFKKKTNQHEQTSIRTPRSRQWQLLKKKTMKNSTRSELGEMIELW